MVIVQMERKDGFEIYIESKINSASCLLECREVWERKEPKVMVELHKE